MMIFLYSQDKIQCWDGYGHQICVFKEDGTEVDEEYFEVLLNNTMLMVHKSGEVWKKASNEFILDCISLHENCTVMHYTK